MHGDDDRGDGGADVVAERIGRGRAAELRDELAVSGFEIVDSAELATLRFQAAGYRKMASLVEQPDDDTGSLN